MSKLNNLKLAVSKATGRTGLIIQKNSPQILLGVGIVSIVGGTIMACRGTLKMNDVLSEHQEKRDSINEALAMESEEYTQDDATKDLTVVFLQTGVKTMKAFAPAITLTTLGIACIMGSHNVMNRRNVALMASYKVLQSGFDSYRGRVADKWGEEEEFNVRHNITKEKMTVEEEDPETGKIKKVKKDATVINGNEKSVYARFFDDGNINWTSFPYQNLIFLKSQQQYMNDLLHARGHLFLNDVYDALGMDRTSQGQVVGWLSGRDGVDNFVDFGIFDSVDFVNGREYSVLLDFNVDGVVYDLI